MQRTLWFGRLVLVAAGVVGCGGQPGITPPSEDVFSSLGISPSTVTMFSVSPGNTATLSATARNQNGVEMAGLGPATFRIDNPAVATIGSGGLVTAAGPGTATVTASLTAGGVTKTATATVVVRAAPLGVTVEAAPGTGSGPSWSPTTVDVRAGGDVIWRMQGIGPHNVTFDSQDAPANIPDTEPGISVGRAFPVAGIYAYQCTIHPATMRGTVIVH